MYRQGIYEIYIKRLFDICLSLLAIVLLAWLYILVAILVRINLGSPVIFKQYRPGKDEEIFTMYKFRSMTSTRDSNGRLLPDDKRLTKFGKILRASSLDELPELFNVLNGTMSLIGPRPQLIRDMVFMTAEQRQRHSVRPGLSGLAQVSGRNALLWEQKLQKDIQYISLITFKGDFKIMLKTIEQVVFRRKGLKAGNQDEIEIVDDFGDYLLKKGSITREDYDQKQLEAKKIIEGL